MPVAPLRPYVKIAFMTTIPHPGAFLEGGAELADPATHAAGWYDTHATQFTVSSLSLDVSPLRDQFIEGLTPGSTILEAGCGAGRDVLAFIEAGFDVTAFDASREMCLSTERLTEGKADIRHCSFKTFDANGVKFDGIWAMASLIHLPRLQLLRAMRSLVSHLSPNGRFYTCFKDGAGEQTDSQGRHMSYLSLAELEAMLLALDLPGAEIEVWPTYSPSSNGQLTTWVNGMLCIR